MSNNIKNARHRVELVKVLRITRSGQLEGQLLNSKAQKSDKTTKELVLFDESESIGPEDTVIASIVGRKKTKTDPILLRGRVIKKLSNHPKMILGIYKKGPLSDVIIPAHKKERFPVSVKENNTSAIDGSLVKAQLLKSKSGSGKSARIVKNLGTFTDDLLPSILTIHEYNLPTGFTQEIRQSAKKISKIDISKLPNLRDIPFISIDPQDARDQDDAICAEYDKDNQNIGGFILWVAIADVARYVEAGSDLDKEALQRGNSTYLPNHVIPMLPENLSNSACSLIEGKDRACIVLTIRVSSSGKKLSHTFSRGVIKNRFSITYEKAQQIIDNRVSKLKLPYLKKLVTSLNAAYEAIELETQKRQPLDLEIQETQLTFGSSGRIKSLDLKSPLTSHKIVESFMVLANVCAAETLLSEQKEFLYRIHEQPSKAKYLDIKALAKSVNNNLKGNHKLSSADLNHILQKSEIKNRKEFASMQILRSLSQAKYSPKNCGHFGLNLPLYTHFTSPIRRYSDLTVHRALNCFIDKKKSFPSFEDLEKIGQHLNETERQSVQAERDATDRQIARFVEQKDKYLFAAQITSITKFGLFVRLDQIGADAFVPMSTINGDRFYVSKDGSSITGRKSKLSISLSDKLCVNLIDANSISGRLTFSILKVNKKTIQKRRKHRTPI